MGLIDFVRSAGEKLFGNEEKENAAKAAALARFVNKLGLTVQNLEIDVADDVATVSGTAPDQQTREKIVLAVGNTTGIVRVDDRITVAPPKAATVEPPKPAAVYYTVVSGDTLGGIAKKHYGAASKYPAIFEANKPMLTDPNKIYPGQVLRIPPVQAAPLLVMASFL
jgi:nucleoid-associated protein YgaU